MKKADMIYDLSSLWTSVKEEFPYFDRLPFDWDEQYRLYLEKLLLIDDEGDFHSLLSEFMESLQDGHTKYIPPEGFREAKPFVRPAGPSHSIDAGVLTIRLNEFLSDHAAYVRKVLSEHQNVSLVRLDIRDNIGGNTFYAANVAKLFISGVFHGCQKWTQIRRACDAASASQLARDSEERIRKYLKDGLLKEEDITDAQNEMRRTKYETYTDTHGSADNVALYEGPLQLLISRRTMSAAEDFTAMFKSSRRATLIGEPTFGSTGTPYMIPLRCGGRAQVVSVGYRLLDGTEFIGRGIEPDIRQSASS
ncbi:MAG: hypothetical protein IKH34_00865 [Oscillospiraceae bacterium]|nr:hypothetical protein [Oscillospiraceae bacterium]